MEVHFFICNSWLLVDAVFNMGRCKLGRQNVYKYHSLPFVLLLQKLLSISSLNFKWCKTTVIPHSIHVLSILLMLDSMMMQTAQSYLTIYRTLQVSYFRISCHNKCTKPTNETLHGLTAVVFIYTLQQWIRIQLLWYNKTQVPMSGMALSMASSLLHNSKSKVVI